MLPKQSSFLSQPLAFFLILGQIVDDKMIDRVNLSVVVLFHHILKIRDPKLFNPDIGHVKQSSQDAHGLIRDVSEAFLKDGQVLRVGDVGFVYEEEL